MNDKLNPALYKHNFYINEVSVADYGVLVESYKVSGTAITNNVYQGVGRTTFSELSYKLGMKTISVNLFYSGKTQKQLTQVKSTIDGLLIDKVELHLPDGFYYTSVCTNFGEAQILGVEDNMVIALCAYTFTGVCHDPLRTWNENKFYAEGTMPKMDCRLSCTATSDHEELTLGTVTFSDVHTGDVVVADGMTGELSINGSQVLASFSKLPYVTPGLQEFECPETLTIEYYPTWI